MRRFCPCLFLLIPVTCVVLQSCSDQSSTVTPNLAEYRGQVNEDKISKSLTQGAIQPSTPSGTLTIWTPDYKGLNKVVQEKINSTITELIMRFENRYNLVDVVWKKYSDTYIYKLYSDRINDGLGPDLFLAHNFMIPELSRNNEISSIPRQHVKFKSLRPRLENSYTINGQAYAVPFLINIQLLCYNRLKVKEPPSTFSELVDLSQSGVSTAIGGTFLDQMWGLSGFGASIFGTNISDSAKLVQGLKGWIKTLYQLDQQPNFALFKNSTAMNKYFMQGQLSIISCSSIDLPLLREKLGYETLGVSALPSINGVPAHSRLTGASFVTNPYMNQNQRDIAYRFINFSISTDQQQQIAIDWGSLLPVNKNADFNQKLLPIFSVSKEAYSHSFQLNSSEINALSANFNAIQDLFDDGTSGLIDPENASRQIVALLEVSQ